ncbi:MAG: acyl-CoA thioesterase [Proteobacteria bacterium]|nr:acyl-CoA thioesterase [Pseudomonadota bacterium]
MTFAAQITVRFNHVDAAGIVFYPRYYEMLNEVVERWFDEGLGTSFRDLHLVQKVGVPARNIAVDFLKASRLGDVLTFELQVQKVGRSSLTLKIDCWCDGAQRLSADLVLVCVSLSPFATASIPAALRERMMAFTGPS